MSGGLPESAALPFERSWGESAPADLQESVHKVRTRIKKLRALARLIRGRCDEELYRKQNRALRSLARAFSPLRDLEAKASTLQKLRYEGKHRITAKDHARLQAVLLEKRERLLSTMKRSKKSWSAEVDSAIQGIGNWPAKGLKRRDLRSGIKRAYRKFVRSHEEAKRSPTNGHLHEWRKRTKGLAYNLALTQATGADSTFRLLGTLTQLGKHLGNDRDLSLLEDDIGNENSPASGRVRNAIRVRRAESQKVVFKLGRRVKAACRLRFPPKS